MVYQQRINPASQFALLLGLCGAGLVIGSIATIVIAKILMNVPLSNLEDALLNPANANVSRVLQVVGTLCMMALPAIFFSIIVDKKPFSYIGFGTAISFKQIAAVVLIMFAALFAGDLFAEINKWIPIPQKMALYFNGLEESYDKEIVALADMKNRTDYFISIIVIALMPAIFEEMLFRGCLQQVMISLTKNAFWGILITSALFSAIHFSYYGFLPRLFLGMVLGYIFYYSKNIWLNILGHFLNNAIGVTQIYLLSREGKLTTDSMDTHFPWFYGLAALAAVYFFIEVYKKESEKVLAPKIIHVENTEINIF